MLHTDARTDEGGDRVPALVASVGAADPDPQTLAASSVQAGQSDRHRRPFRAVRAGRSVVATVRWTCIVLALVVTGGSVLLTALGYRVMVVTSGSMEPSINPGDAVIVSQTGSDGVRVGDVITFRGYGADGMTTHRVLKAMTVDSRLHFQTQGDANDTPDVNLAPGEGVFGKVAFRIPALGQELHWASTPRGKLFVLAFPVLTILIQEALVLWRETRRGGPRARPRHALRRTAP